MRESEKGFLLLTSHLGDPARPVLTTAQFRTLAKRMQQVTRQGGNREMIAEDLIAMGFNRQMAERICGLLGQTEQLRWYLRRGNGCLPITRVSDGYPQLLRNRLGLDSPGCLWAKGDVTLLKRPAVALVGSRALKPENAAFARRVGQEAARQGYVLISGNATGADRTAQDACLEAGGYVISIVADTLMDHPLTDNVLYLAEDGYDMAFSAQRALSRNRLIHSMGKLTLVAQCDLGKGGTWDGTAKNLRHNWSPVFCFADGSPAATELIQRGAVPVDMAELSDFTSLQPSDVTWSDF